MKRFFILSAAIAMLGAGAVFAQEEQEQVQVRVQSREEQPAQSQSSASQGTEEAAENPDDTTVHVITIEDDYSEMHPTANSVTLQLQYTPLTEEGLFIYTCPQSSFDLGDAMNVARAVYEDFVRENPYSHRQRLGKDRQTYFRDDNGIRMATYISRVVFTR